MNRLVSLLLVAFSLAAVSLAQPAQAQQAQWYKGLPYYYNTNTQSGGNVTTSPVGHINITSTPSPYYAGYNMGGSYNGSVGIYYVWGGGSLTSAMTMSTSQSYEITGAGSSFSSGGSFAEGSREYFSSSITGWDTRTSTVPLTNYYDAGVTPPSVNRSASLGGNIDGNYDPTHPGAQTIVTADVTFSDPVVTQ